MTLMEIAPEQLLQLRKQRRLTRYELGIALMGQKIKVPDVELFNLNGRLIIRQGKDLVRDGMSLVHDGENRS
jgi:hypothetical protein